MGMTTHIVGFIPPDEKWRKNAAAWKACEEAEIELPQELMSYFGGEDPTDMPGREVDIEPAVANCGREGTDGWEVTLAKLPPEVKVIRFENSY